MAGADIPNSEPDPELLVADVEDLVALHAAGGLHLDGVAGGLADQRAGDADPLLLAARERAGPVAQAVAEAELADVIGAGFATRGDYGDGTHTLTWRYNDGVYKLLHVTFGPDNRVIRYSTEWDPNVYSKKSR
jgi:hypothetical protein